MKYLRLNLVFLSILFLLSSCSMFRELKENSAREKTVKENQGKIEVGMSKDEVIKLLIIQKNGWQNLFMPAIFISMRKLILLHPSVFPIVWRARKG